MHVILEISFDMHIVLLNNSYNRHGLHVMPTTFDSIVVMSSLMEMHRPNRNKNPFESVSMFLNTLTALKFKKLSLQIIKGTPNWYIHCSIQCYG